MNIINKSDFNLKPGIIATAAFYTGRKKNKIILEFNEEVDDDWQCFCHLVDELDIKGVLNRYAEGDHPPLDGIDPAFVTSMSEDPTNIVYTAIMEQFAHVELEDAGSGEVLVTLVLFNERFIVKSQNRKALAGCIK